MPNKTFNNLPLERQTEIKEIALKEFLEHDYEASSLNQIVMGLGITRGSFYRYFDSKEALYQYLIKDVMLMKEEYINNSLNLETNDFFAILRHAMKRHVCFMQEHPLQAGFLSRVFQNGDISIQEFLFLSSGQALLSQGVTEFQKNSDINPNLNPELVVFVLTNIVLDFGKFLKSYFRVSDEETFHLEMYDPNKLDEMFDQVIHILKYGLASR